MGSLNEKINNLNPIFQNIIMGAVTGILTGYVIKEAFRGRYDLVWILMIVIGPVIGFLSGRERLRLEKIKLEKSLLEEDMDKLQSSYKQAVNKYRLLFENINDAIYLTSQDGRFLLFNDALCLVSGYSRDELKSLKLIQLQVDEASLEDHRRAWLDNGICRFEESWKTKDGAIVHLDVNSKWIKLAKNQYILHIARDTVRRPGTAESSRFSDTRRFHENRLTELARASQAFFRLIGNPIGNTFSILGAISKQVPSESDNIEAAASEWDKVRKVLQVLTLKNTRDTLSADSEWKLNDVIMQELHYLDIIASDQNVMVTTRLAPDTPGIYASGRHLSMVFGSVFLALVKAMQKAPSKKMAVITKSADGHAVVEIRASQAGPFEQMLTRVVDPSVAEESSPSGDKGMTEIGLVLDLFNGKMEVSHPDDSTLVTIRIQTARGKRSSSEARKSPKPPVKF